MPARTKNTAIYRFVNATSLFLFFKEVSTMTENTNNAKAVQKRVGLTVFVTEEMRDKLLCIANAEDLSMSDVLRRAIKEYTDKVNE